MTSRDMNNRAMKAPGKTRILVAVLFAFCLLASWPQMVRAQYSMTIQNGATFSGSGTIIVKGQITNAGVASATTIPGKVILAGTSSQSVGTGGAGEIIFDTLTVNSGASKTLNVNITANDSLTVNLGATDSLIYSGAVITVKKFLGKGSGVLSGNGSSRMDFTRNDGTTQSIPAASYPGKVLLSGSSRKSIAGVAVADSLTHSGGALSIDENLTINGRSAVDTILTVAAGKTFQLGSTISTIARVEGIASTGILAVGSGNTTITTLAGNSGTIQATAAGTLTFTNAAVNGTGAITTATSTVTFASDIASTGTLSVTGSGTMQFGGTVSSTAYSFAGGSTQVYNGSTQTIPLTNHGNLTLGNTGTKTFGSGKVGVAGTFTIGGTATASFSAGDTLSYNGTAAQTVLALPYQNLQLTTSGVKTFAADTTAVAGELLLGGSASADLTTNSTKIHYNGSSAQTVAGLTYYDVIFSNTGTKTLSGSATFNNNGTVNAGAMFIISVTGALDFTGDFDNFGTLITDGPMTGN